MSTRRCVTYFVPKKLANLTSQKMTARQLEADKLRPGVCAPSPGLTQPGQAARREDKGGVTLENIPVSRLLSKLVMLLLSVDLSKLKYRGNMNQSNHVKRKSRDHHEQSVVTSVCTYLLYSRSHSAQEQFVLI